MKVLYGLPKKILFCKKTLMSNQRPTSAIEFKHQKKTKKKTIDFDKNGISKTWYYSRQKKRINWKRREQKLLKLLDKHRGKYGEFDCIVPGSGGKDSCMASHTLKFKYDMNPLTVTWPPILYTKYGYQNYKNWISSGKLSNICAKRDEQTMRILTKLSIKNLFHPFQTFILGQKIFASKIAIKMQIPLIFFGENEAEHGNNVVDNKIPNRNNKYYAAENLSNLYLSGIKIKELIDLHQLKEKNLKDFLPTNLDDIQRLNIDQQYLGYYLKWTPQETFYFAVNNGGFLPRPFRTQGTYSKYNSIDDKIDDLHYYTQFIKFGYGRAHCDVSQEIRNDHLTINEGLKLVKKYDGEFPDVYFNDVIDYLDIKKSEFFKLTNRFRSPHIWAKIGGEYKLRHTANKDGVND
ncbi:N-acetyl sugar amidotransferase [Pelagibacterales bacterium SAG-MED23]|nr:N-acetyl sugar amidotransferase [Pelagibacterales bacterium SAG-MED23]